MPLEEVLAIEAYTRRGTGTVRVITPYGSLTVDQILAGRGRCSPLTPERQSAANLARARPARRLAEVHGVGVGGDDQGVGMKVL